jgi:hypothetical protein
MAAVVTSFTGAGPDSEGCVERLVGEDASRARSVASDRRKEYESAPLASPWIVPSYTSSYGPHAVRIV